MALLLLDGSVSKASFLCKVQLKKHFRKLENKEHLIAGAGRTDAGVHAKVQVAHCDLDKKWEPFSAFGSFELSFETAPNSSN